MAPYKSNSPSGSTKYRYQHKNQAKRTADTTGSHGYNNDPRGVSLYIDLPASTTMTSEVPQPSTQLNAHHMSTRGKTRQLENNPAETIHDIREPKNFREALSRSGFKQ